MSNLKKNGQQMNTGESIGATGMGQKKSQILGQLLTQVTSRSQGPIWKCNRPGLAVQLEKSIPKLYSLFDGNLEKRLGNLIKQNTFQNDWLAW